MRRHSLIHHLLISVALIIALLQPIAVFADDPPPPPGYTYDSSTNLWSNGTYSWDPATGKTTPLQPTDYSYNPTTNHWDTTAYAYDPTTSTYVPNTPPPQGPTAPTGPTGQVGPANQTAPTEGSSITDTGPSSNNTITDQGASNGFFSNFYNASISNILHSTARTGDAAVSGNTSSGDATSGNAVVTANMVNLIASLWQSLGGVLATFNANLVGNVNGDLLINPSASVTHTGPSSNNQITGGQNNTLTINNQGTGQINNNLTLAASSGSATVDSNTSGGDATSGNARVIANLINGINSSIRAGQSFLGVINILGNLNGDILLPPGFIDQLIAATGPNSNNQITSGGTTTATVANTTNQTINNTINTTAQSGAATVSDNTTAGDAHSGTASTNVTLLNLTGRNVIDQNTLFVFVNVLGHWVGLIMDAPNTNAAVLGGGVTNSNLISGGGTSTLLVTNTDNQTINNTVDAQATTGDASVTNNTTGGNATTGNAQVGVNVLNLLGSNIDASGWLGILFINVFGDWNGSFGVNTSAGDPTTPPSSPASSPAPTPQTFTFIPRPTTAVIGGGVTNQQPPTDIITASATAVPAVGVILRQPTTTSSSHPSGRPIDWVFTVVLFAALLGLATGVDRIAIAIKKSQA